jgi:hypothetical protein
MSQEVTRRNFVRLISVGSVAATCVPFSAVGDVNHATRSDECALLDRSHNGLTNPQDTSGIVYVRDRESGQYFCINSPAAGTDWQCRHGMGYTTIRASAPGLTAEVTYFVPRKDSLVVWMIKVEATGTASRDSGVPPCSEIGEIFLPEFGGSANSRRSSLLLQLAQLHPADLTGNSLR